MKLVMWSQDSALRAQASQTKKKAIQPGALRAEDLTSRTDEGEYQNERTRGLCGRQWWLLVPKIRVSDDETCFPLLLVGLSMEQQE